MWSGLVPRHPPSKRTPAATQPSASATKSAGGMTSTKFQFGSVKYPDSGVHGCFRHQVLVTRMYPHAIKAIMPVWDVSAAGQFQNGLQAIEPQRLKSILATEVPQPPGARHLIM